VKIGNQFTLVKPFPISIAFTLKDYDNDNETKTKQQPSEILKQYGLQADYLGIEWTGLITRRPHRKISCHRRFLEKYPFYQGQFTFVQIGAPSRSLLKTYADTISAVEQEANRIN
jgi:trehalose 6-phosphate synthase